jgi:hypothetical protein
MRSALRVCVRLSMDMGFCSRRLCQRRNIGVHAAEIADHTDDVRAIKAIVARQFGSLSWAPGTSADWDAFARDFSPGAVLYPAARPAKGQTMGAFAERMKDLAETKLHSFREAVLAVEIRVFGNAAVAVTGCEITENDAEVIRGVEMLLLIKNGNVWQIVLQAWDTESASEPIPSYLLGGAGSDSIKCCGYVPMMVCVGLEPWARRGRVDTKDGIVPCDRFKGGDRRVIEDREVVATTRGHLAPGLEDWRSLLGWDFGEHDRARSAPLDQRLSARCADVSHPLRIVPKHRDEIALTLMRGDDEDGCAEATAAPAFHLQREQDSGRQAKPGCSGAGPAHNLPQAGRAPVSVEEAQVTSSFGRISARRLHDPFTKPGNITDPGCAC